MKPVGSVEDGFEDPTDDDRAERAEEELAREQQHG
jgi:hypothetical protein